MRVQWPRRPAHDARPLPECFPAASLKLLNHGLELDGRRLRPAQVEWINADQLRFVLREGRKRQIRRVAAALGHPVRRLIRERIGPLSLGELKPGEWRYLTPAEVRELRESAAGSGSSAPAGRAAPSHPTRKEHRAPRSTP